MSDNDQKPGKVIRTSSGSTRLSAGGSAKGAGASGGAPVGSGPAGAQGASGPATRVDAPAVPSDRGPSGAPAGTAPARQTVSAPTGSAPTGSAPTGSAPTGSAPTGSAPTGSAPTAVKTDGSARTSGTTRSPLSAGADDDGDSPVRASSGGVKMGGKSKRKGPRTVRLTVAKLDPWSVMKMAFLLSVAIGIATVVAALVLWLVLQATGTIQGLQTTLAEIAGTEGADQLLGLFSLGRVLSFSVILALVNIVLMTALSTLFAFLYNIGSSIVGGFHLTLTDD